MQFAFMHFFQYFFLIRTGIAIKSLRAYVATNNNFNLRSYGIVWKGNFNNCLN